MTANGQQPMTYNYDPASRLTQVAQGSLFAALGYDNANRRTSLSYSNGTTTGYAYDLASQLTNITHSGPSGVIDALTYTYDGAGNRFSANRANGTASLLPNVVASAAYDVANEQTSFASANLTYDANGNLTNDGVNTYQWDARNRLVGISGGATANFAYDPLGRRVAKTIGGVTTSFLHDGNDVTAEMGSGAIGTAYLRSLNIDEMFGFLRQDGAYFSIYDGLGSTLALTNQSGSPTVQYSYEPFGKTQSSDPSFGNPFQFTGRENDGTGLYYYRARYYNPVVNRFISQDPLNSPLQKSTTCRGNYAPSVYDLVEIDSALVPLLRLRYINVAMTIGFDAQKLHAYAYADNTPLNKLDPMGLISGPQSPGCDVVGPAAQFLSCAFDCCEAHDRCYERARSYCSQASWDSRNKSYNSDCWGCNVAAAKCFLRNSLNIGSRKPCNVSGFPF